MFSTFSIFLGECPALVPRASGLTSKRDRSKGERVDLRERKKVGCPSLNRGEAQTMCLAGTMRLHRMEKLERIRVVKHPLDDVYGNCRSLHKLTVEA